MTAISYTSLSGFSRSWRAVVSGADAGDLYVRAPASIEGCRAAAEETLRQARPWRELAELLERNARLYGLPESVQTRLDAVVEGEAVMVVSGQQVGYLGGPLYTFLKAYHTTRLAADLEKELRRPVLPLFWLEGEDHDLEEVRNACLLDRSGEIQCLRFTPENEIAGFEAGRYAVDAEEHIAQIEAALDSADAESLDILRRAYSQTTLSKGLGRLLAEALGPRGLLIVDGAEPDIKRIAAPLWENVVAHGSRLADLLAKRSAHLHESGWSTPLNPTPDSYLFYLTGEDHVRCALSYQGRWQHPDGRTKTISRDDLRRRVREHPESVSPKAALRPLYQDYVLPTVAYIAGPGEMDYHAQIAPLYRELGVSAPSLFPRLSVTLLDERTLRLVNKSGCDLTALLTEERDSLLKRAVRAEDEGRTAEAFEASRRVIEEVYARIKAQLTAIDPTLEGAAHSAAGKSLHPLDELRQKAERALKQKHSTTLARLEKCLTALRPQDKLAERVFCTGYYLARLGAQRLLSVLDQMPAEAQAHQVVTI